MATRAVRQRLLNRDLALEATVKWSIVIVVAAATTGIEVPRLLRLTGIHEPDVVQFWTVGGFRMRIRMEVVRPGIGVRKQNPCALRNVELLGRDTRRADSYGDAGFRRIRYRGGRRWTAPTGRRN